jgi:hypothetical protein
LERIKYAILNDSRDNGGMNPKKHQEHMKGKAINPFFPFIAGLNPWTV